VPHVGRPLIAMLCAEPGGLRTRPEVDPGIPRCRGRPGFALFGHGSDLDHMRSTEDFPRLQVVMVVCGDVGTRDEVRDPETWIGVLHPVVDRHRRIDSMRPPQPIANAPVVPIAGLARLHDHAGRVLGVLQVRE